MPIDRDRERAKRRYNKRAANLQARAARRRRSQQIFGAVVAVLVVAAGVYLMAKLTGGTSAPVAKPAATSTAATPSPSATATRSPQSYSTPPPSSLAAGATWSAQLATSAGRLTLSLDGKKAPQTVSSFVFLSGKKFYDGTSCHRLTTQGIYVLQCGDPTGTGSGGPGYQYGIENAPADGKYPAGTVAMARASDPKSNGSQFFLVYKDSQLPTDGGGYTIFGTVTEGLDVLRQIAAKGTANGGGDGAPKQPVTIETIKVAKQ